MGRTFGSCLHIVVSLGKDVEIKGVKAEIGAEVFAAGRFDEAAKRFPDMTTSEEFGDFLTLPAYEMI